MNSNKIIQKAPIQKASIQKASIQKAPIQKTPFPIYPIMTIISIVLISLCLYFLVFNKSTSNTISSVSDPEQQAINAEIKAMTLPDTLVSNIKTCTLLTIPLSQYAIKGSYNSAVSGNYVSTDAIKYAIKRGCRFLDFQVFVGPFRSTTPTAFVTSIYFDNTGIVSQSLNGILLDNVLSACISNAFSASVAPNFGDPLFINLRLVTNTPSPLPIINSIKYALLPKLYVDDNGNAINVTKDTYMGDIMGKIILSIDVRGNDPKNLTTLNPYTNMFFNTIAWRKYSYKNVNTMPSNAPTFDPSVNLTNVTELVCVTPDSNKDTIIPLPYSIFADHGMQTILLPLFSVNNKVIVEYEQLFNTCKGGVIPLVLAIVYSQPYLSFEL